MLLLSEQIQIPFVDTGNFYSKHEMRLHKQNHKLRNERKQLLNGYTQKTKSGKRVIKGLKDIEKELEEFGLTVSDLENVGTIENNLEIGNIYDNYTMPEQLAIVSLCNEYHKIKELIEHKRERIKKTKDELLSLLENKTNANIQSKGHHHIREMKDNDVAHIKEISVFTSAFTRMIGAEIDERTDDFMVVQVYYFEILHDIMLYGFMYEGEKYRYFTSSAGQIRLKKGVFVKENVWQKYEKTIMCGLSIDEINAKGGINACKFLSYVALSNSATDLWEEFDIDKTIVIDDFETMVEGEADYIDDSDFSITRKKMKVPIPHTDGCGMMLPNAFGKPQKNMMVRLPFVKGLLGIFPFDKFIKDKNGNAVINDIYGTPHNVIEEDIQVIFTKSQVKLWKYFDSWKSYQENFKKYNCQAGVPNIEEDRIKTATINYQMLQSLTQITDEQIYDICKDSIFTLQNVSVNIEGVKNTLGVTPYNTNKTYLQKAINLYPELMNDVFVKNKLRDIKDSLVKNYKSGKLRINGKYTFILPDLYAACEYWFLNNSNPQGLLENGEVFCWLYRKDDKLDCLRSPHLSLEHCVRKNIACRDYGDRQQEIREWFGSNALYTSCHDLISKVLQFDVDGDSALVVADKTLIEVAEYNVKYFDVVPLYYEMKKATSGRLDNEGIYQSLVLAFTSAPIGVISNNISKIWNSDIFVNGTFEEQKHAVDCIKRLTAFNNFAIDAAKTLYMPEFPRQIKKDIQEFTKQQLPHFFMYAKDKDESKVRKRNDVFVNKLDTIIPNPRISCKYLKDNGKTQKLGKPDYRLLMTDPTTEIVDVSKNPVCVKYNELSTKYGMKINAINESGADRHLPREVLYKSQLKKMILYGKIYKQVRKDMSEIGLEDWEIADILVKYLYDKKNSGRKDLLWSCYGDFLYNNLVKNVKSKKKEIQCMDCGEWFEVLNKDNETCRCASCYREYRRKYKAQKERERRMRIKLNEDVDSTKKS